MASQALLWFCIFLAVVFVISFLWGRKGKSPSQLSLRSTLKGPRVPTARNRSAPDVHFHTGDDADPGSKNSKSLNVMFVYNGHTFDAYEVLGIPAGSSLEAAKKAFDTQTPTAKNPEQKDFLQTALTAIKISKS